MYYNGCYAEFDGEFLKIGNSKIERVIQIYNNYPTNKEVTDKVNGKTYTTPLKTLLFNLSEFDFDKAEYTFNSYVKPQIGYSTEGLVAELLISSENKEYKLVYTIKPNTSSIRYNLYFKGDFKKPFAEEKWRMNISSQYENLFKEKGIYDPHFGAIDCFTLLEKHLTLTAIDLKEDTDYNGDIFTEKEILTFPSSAGNYQLNAGVFECNENGLAFMITRDCYVMDKGRDDVLVFTGREYVAIRGNDLPEDRLYDDYISLGGTTITVGKRETILETYRKDFLYEYYNVPSYTISNTWGDGNQDSRICEEFILKEIDTAEILGVDVVQIDDGWQTGKTMNSAFFQNKNTWGDFYDDDSNFWKVDEEKFPSGLKVISDYAKQKGVKLGLWFAMDKPNNYANWSKDAEVILKMHNDFDVEYFKIDSLVISNPLCENNIYNFVKKVKEESNGKVKLNMDITNSRRFGYYIHPESSTLFVENRYLKSTTYYPHTTLRGLWNLSKLFPTRRFQFEVVNNGLFDEKYKENVLRPSVYPIDYLFTSVMVANPLMWMELSSLSTESIEKLKKIIKVYKDIREDFTNSLVTPMGDKPNGFRETGFYVKAPNGNAYAICLFEPLSKGEIAWNLPDNYTGFEILARSDDGVLAELENNVLKVATLSRPAYAVIKLK